MEIVNTNCATLCNFEVMKHLQKIKDSRQNNKGQLATITYETLRYLESSPCKEQTSTAITDCMKDLEPFRLTKTEKLMIVNNPPTSPLEIQLMIEESEERLTEEQVQNVLDIVVKHFPHVQKVAQEKPEEEEETAE